MTIKTSFEVKLGIEDLELLRENVDPGAPAAGVSPDDQRLIVMATNAKNPVEQTGFRILETEIASQGKDDRIITLTCEIFDAEALLTEARERYFACWHNRDWSPETIEEALYEVLVASNAGASPADLGFEIRDMSVPDPHTFDSAAPSPV